MTSISLVCAGGGSETEASGHHAKVLKFYHRPCDEGRPRRL